MYIFTFFPNSPTPTYWPIHSLICLHTYLPTLDGVELYNFELV